jgi:hypothetical protein
MKTRQQGSTVHPISFLLVSSLNHITGAAAPAITVFKISKDGGATWSNPAGALTPSTYGWHRWSAAAADRDTLGELNVHIEADGCDPIDEKYDIVAYDPYAYPSFTATERAAIADTVLTRDWTQIAMAVPARCMLQALRFLRNKWWVDLTGLLTVTTETDATPAWTSQVITRAGADPITGNVPN